MNWKLLKQQIQQLKHGLYDETTFRKLIEHIEATIEEMEQEHRRKEIYDDIWGYGYGP